MSKEFYFAVYVSEDGTATIDTEMEVNYGGGNVWDTEVENWSDASDDDNYEQAEMAYHQLNALLNPEKREK